LLVYWLPRLCSPMLACSAERRVLVCTIGTSPLSMWWWVVDACTLFTTPITVSARICQLWQVPPWSWILRTRRVQSKKSNLWVVWRGSQRVNYLFLCTVMYMFVKQWRNCGWRWDLINNTILSSFILCILQNLLYIIKILFFKHSLNQPRVCHTLLNSFWLLCDKELFWLPKN
jgi:hypothetical protein